MSLTTSRRGRATALAAGIALSLLSMNANAARVVLPTGTVIPVKLNQELNSKTARPGDRFTATVRYGRDDAGLPEGTYVVGVVRDALPAADGKPGVLDVDFRSMTFPSGETKAMDASLISLGNKDVKRSNGRLVASSSKSKDRLKFIGIGAGAGLLIGALTKGNTLTDVLLGAGAGYLYNELKKDKPGDVKLGEGTEFGVRLDSQFAYNDYGSRSSASRTDAYNRAHRSSSDRYYDDNVDNQTTTDRISDRTGRPTDDRYYDRTDRVSRDADNSRTAIGVLVNDREVRFNGARPFMRNDIAFVPLEAVSRVADFDYHYDSLNKTIFARRDDIRMGIGSRIALVNGERRRLNAAPEIRDGTIYVPMQFLALATNGSAYWDAPSHTVVVTTHAYDRNDRP